MNGTIHIHAADEPLAQIITDALGNEFLLTKPENSLDGVYIEITHEFKESLRAIVKTWDEEDEGRTHDAECSNCGITIEDGMIHFPRQVKGIAGCNVCFDPASRAQLETRP
jgi:hypothetical protein